MERLMSLYEPSYKHVLDRIIAGVDELFEYADDEEGVVRLEKMVYQEIMYRAAIAQSNKVMPPNGWDLFGR